MVIMKNWKKLWMKKFFKKRERDNFRVKEKRWAKKGSNRRVRVKKTG